MMHSNDTDRSGPYELLGPLGRDALTRAFVARRAGSAALVRLELLHPELARDDRFRARFLDQTAAMLSLSHPVLPRVWEVLSEADVCGVALELAPGRPLTEVLQRTGRARCPVDLHVHLLRRVLDGLEHAHRQPGSGFVHGDVCPSRVQIGYGGEVQLLGGGLAACRHALSQERGRPAVDVRYAAPEVLLGGPASPSSDLYGLSVMLWEALTRQSRTADADLGNVSRRRALGAEPDLESAWPDAPDALLDFFARALAVSPQERHASAAEMAAELDAYLARAGEPSAIVLGRVPGWLTATFGARDAALWRSESPASRRSEPPSSRSEPHSRRSEPPSSRSEPHSRRSVAASVPPPPPEAQPASHSGLAPALEASPPLPSGVERRSDTGGHRAFSSTWIGPAPTLPSPWPALRAALPALAVALGAVGAVWAIAAQRTSGDSSADMATALAASLPSVPASDPLPHAAHERSAGVRQNAADAGVEPSESPPRAKAPAFLAGRAPSGTLRADALAPLAADELPQVDDARDSLQAAIVRAARAQRRAVRARRARPTDRPTESPAAAAPLPNAPREIDTADPYERGEPP